MHHSTFRNIEIPQEPQNIAPEESTESDDSLLILCFGILIDTIRVIIQVILIVFTLYYTVVFLLVYIEIIC